MRDVLPTSLALPHPDSCPGLWGSWRGIGGTRMARGALRVDLWRETPEVSACCGFRLPGGVFGGRASPVGDSSSWQLSPDMSAHRGSLLPSVPGTGAVWQQMPDMSTHIGSLLTLSGWQESSPTPHLGKRRVRLASSGNHLTGKYSHRTLAAIGGRRAGRCAATDESTTESRRQNPCA